MKNWFKASLIVLAVILMSRFAMGAYDELNKGKVKPSKEDLYNQVELLAQSIDIVRSDYVEEVDSKKLVYGAMKGMLESLDDYSQFMEPDEYNEIRLETKGEFGGIGVEISTRDGIITVIAPLSGTPADIAGIKAGDKIVRIDGEMTKGLSISEAVKKMRGKPGTTLKLTVWREKDEKILDIQVKRAIIKINSIKNASLVEDKIGYIKLVEFQENTPKDLEEALKKLESQGMDSLILDLRDNPGGLLDISVDVSEKFLPKDTLIVSIKSRNKDQDMEFKAKGDFSHPAYPLIIMVNEGSASASEIVAGAIQDTKRGIILGTKSFGKGSVQTVIPLKDGSALRLTTASYVTPSGRMIRDQGITPDVVVEMDPSKDKGKTKDSDIFEKVEIKEKGPVAKKDQAKSKKIKMDNQLERAVDLMKAIKVYKSQTGQA